MFLFGTKIWAKKAQEYEKMKETRTINRICSKIKQILFWLFLRPNSVVQAKSTPNFVENVYTQGSKIIQKPSEPIQVKIYSQLGKNDPKNQDLDASEAKFFGSNQNLGKKRPKRLRKLEELV